MTGILLKFSNDFLAKNIPKRATVEAFKDPLKVSFQTLSEQTKTNYANQPRLNPKFKDSSSSSSSLPNYLGTFYRFNPFVLNHIGSEVPTVTLRGVITELGTPVIDRRVLVVLMTTDGDVVEKVHTDLEGNFVFYEIPQNMNLMAVAIDNTYKYNAVILSKILTIDNGD